MFTVKLTERLGIEFTHPDDAAEGFINCMALRFDDQAKVSLHVLGSEKPRWVYDLDNRTADTHRWELKAPLFTGCFEGPVKPSFVPLPELLKKYDVTREAWRWWSSAAGDAKPKLRKYFHYYRTSKCTFVDEEAFATLAAKKPLSLWK